MFRACISLVRSRLLLTELDRFPRAVNRKQRGRHNHHHVPDWILIPIWLVGLILLTPLRVAHHNRRSVTAAADGASLQRLSLRAGYRRGRCLRCLRQRRGRGAADDAAALGVRYVRRVALRERDGDGPRRRQRHHRARLGALAERARGNVRRRAVAAQLRRGRANPRGAASGRLRRGNHPRRLFLFQSSPGGRGGNSRRP